MTYIYLFWFKCLRWVKLRIFSNILNWWWASCPTGSDSEGSTEDSDRVDAEGSVSGAGEDDISAFTWSSTKIEVEDGVGLCGSFDATAETWGAVWKNTWAWTRRW